MNSDRLLVVGGLVPLHLITLMSELDAFSHTFKLAQKNQFRRHQRALATLESQNFITYSIQFNSIRTTCRPLGPPNLRENIYKI